jgi:two-component system, NarL family, invasion response regulator UvrY
MTRILIADDHAVARRGIKEILLDAFPSVEIHAVPNAEELKKKVIKEEWSMVIADIAMPGRSGLEVLNELNKEFPNLPVLMLSMHPEEEYAVRVIKAGGAGYLCKEDAVEEELVKAVSAILQGKKYITPSLAERLANEISGDSGKLPHEILSDREFDVFRLLARGISTGKIAERLSVSVNTVGSFRRRVLKKMNMQNNAQLVAYAIKYNLI